MRPGRPPKPKSDPLVLVSRNQRQRLAKRTAKGQQAPLQPTDEQRKTVKMLAAYGETPTHIARMQNITIDTLHKHFDYELAVGAAEANAEVAEALFWNATTGKSVPAQTYWLNSRANWKQAATRIEHTGADGAPIKSVSNSVSIVTDDPVEAARAYQKIMNG